MMDDFYIFAEKCKSMKNSFYYMILFCFLLLAGCSSDNNPVKNENTSSEPTYMEEMKMLDEKLKDWPFPGAHGKYVPSRDPLDQCDTIVDGYGYNHI